MKKQTCPELGKGYAPNESNAKGAFGAKNA